MPHVALSEFADKICEIMPVISREFMKEKPGEFCRSGVTMPQFIVLDFLERNGESKMSDIAGFINTSTASATGLIDRLVREKYVVRTADIKDRRIIKVRLTAKGGKIAKSVIENKKKTVMKLFSMISESDRERYLQILLNIQRHLKTQQKGKAV